MAQRGSVWVLDSDDLGLKLRLFLTSLSGEVIIRTRLNPLKKQHYFKANVAQSVNVQVSRSDNHLFLLR